MKNINSLLLCLLSVLLLTCERDIPLQPEYVIDIDVVSKTEILKSYAPFVYFHPDEGAFPSSVEWAFNYQKRVLRDGKYCLETIQPVEYKYSDIDIFEWVPYDVKWQSFFFGNLASAPIYAFWVEKSHVKAIDLIYFVYYPFNRGNRPEGGIGVFSAFVIGNHVGDWQDIVVRLDCQTLKPVKVLLHYHKFKAIYDWWEFDFYETNNCRTTHPIIYAAYGGHGFWKDPGDHTYHEEGPGGILTILKDNCGKGISWRTWLKIETYDFNNKKGLGNNVWPIWMSDDFTDPGTGNPANPASGSIYRWGNPRGPYTQPGFSDKPILEAGPTGPISKPIFYRDEL